MGGEAQSDSLAPSGRKDLTVRSSRIVSRGVGLARSLSGPDGSFTRLITHVQTLDLGRGVTMILVRIPAGTFLMGSAESAEEVFRRRRPGQGSLEQHEREHPQHQVTITRPFHMGVHEVTQAQYEAVTGKNPSHFKGANNPVDGVSWNDAVAFCQALSRKTGKVVRLPTEAQWEYACRAGTTTPFHTGQTISTDQANYDGDYVYGNGRKGIHRHKPIPVGNFKPNAWGLYDMHGNVAEWCSDWEGPYANAAILDPKGPASGLSRIVRGGSWGFDPGYCRAAARWSCGPAGELYGLLGFRVVVLPGRAD